MLKRTSQEVIPFFRTPIGKRLFHLHTVLQEEELFTKSDRFQDTGEGTFARRWDHHAFKQELTDYGVVAKSGCCFCK